MDTARLERGAFMIFLFASLFFFGGSIVGLFYYFTASFISLVFPNMSLLNKEIDASYVAYFLDRRSF